MIISATEEVFATVAEAQEVDVNRAVAAARKAFDHGPWPRMSHNERAEHMRTIADELDKLADKHAQIWTAESGVLHSLAKARMTGLSATTEFTRIWPRPIRSRKDTRAERRECCIACS